jgi:hypothetical protein
MDFDGGFGDAHLTGDLFVQSALCDSYHCRPLTRRKIFETRSEGVKRFFIRPPRAISLESKVYGVQKVLVPEGLSQELDRARFHRLHSHRDIPMSGDENDRRPRTNGGQITLKFQPAPPRQPYIQHKTRRAIFWFSIQEFSNGGENSGT